MSDPPREASRAHTRLLKCGLEVEDSRAYWRQSSALRATPQRAFDDYWFGARSLSRVEELLRVMRARFDAFPAALETLRRWPHMAPDTRRSICHWHLQLADPLYRRFTDGFLVRRRAGARPHVTRDLVVAWVGERMSDRWTMSTRIQYASKLLTAAYAAGLVTSRRDPRPLALPTVHDEALEYFLYVLRGVRFEGTLLANRYFASVGLEGSTLFDRLRGLPGVDFHRQGDLVELDWRYPDLLAWADANLPRQDAPLLSGGAA